MSKVIIRGSNDNQFNVRRLSPTTRPHSWSIQSSKWSAAMALNMRIADAHASNWNSIWAFNIILLKSLQLVGLFSLLEDAIAIFKTSPKPVRMMSCIGGICWYGFHDCHNLWDENIIGFV
ncbi:hypothetical protein F0562_020451 [Nyssa sinensis]|uniref:Uncharacterized protein n=1 Tax=Nyssa sinensis TaxID=561372 RepID=A0A5J5BTF3_9ASTE|nr:hypothetical protein F0562_020451 [Nyssa sinensis]